MDTFCREREGGSLPRRRTGVQPAGRIPSPDHHLDSDHFNTRVAGEASLTKPTTQCCVAASPGGWWAAVDTAECLTLIHRSGGIYNCKGLGVEPEHQRPLLAQECTSAVLCTPRPACPAAELSTCL